MTMSKHDPSQTHITVKVGIFRDVTTPVFTSTATGTATEIHAAPETNDRKHSRVFKPLPMGLFYCTLR